MMVMYVDVTPCRLAGICVVIIVVVVVGITYYYCFQRLYGNATHKNFYVESSRVASRRIVVIVKGCLGDCGLPCDYGHVLV